MAFRVPEQQIANIKELLELPDDKIEGFLDALVKAEPAFNVFELSSQVSGKSGLPYPLVLGLVRVLASLYATREKDWEQPIEEFLDVAVFAALQRAQTFSAENADVQWRRLRRVLVTALSLERAIGTAAKAGPVLTAHERIFSGARIMTDLRPIFHHNVSEKPDAAMIVHMLKITQRDDFDRKTDQYFALDSNDIATMKELIERAIKKEETLRAIMKDSGVTILAPGLTY